MRGCKAVYFTFVNPTKNVMKKILSLSGLIVLLGLSSCVYSLFPFYTEKTIVYYPELNGKWLDRDSSYLLFEPYHKKEDVMIDLSHLDFGIQSDDGDPLDGKEPTVKKEPDVEEEVRSYKMTIKSAEDTFVYLTHLFQVGESLYLDLFPWLEEGVHQVRGDKIVVDNLFPVHTIMKIEIKEDKLSLTQFDLNKLHNLFKSNLIRLRHEMINDEVLITAKPEDLQKFLKNYARDPSVYDSTEEYIKAR